MLKILHSVKKAIKSDGMEPKNETVDFLLSFSKSVEVKNTSDKSISEPLLIHLN